MKELSIHISDADMDGFSYKMVSNSLLLFKRRSKQGETITSVIHREGIGPDIRIKIIWNNRKSVLVPSSIFRIEDMSGYLGYITSILYCPQCIQCGEFVAVWDVDSRIEELQKISEETGIAFIHTHQRVEHIVETADGILRVSLIDNLLYISEREEGRLKNSFVARVQEPADALYYIASATDGQKSIFTTMPENWTRLVGEYFDIKPVF